jgi:ribosomal-protein-serine acetyltransferase
VSEPTSFAAFQGIVLDDGLTLRLVSLDDAPALAAFVEANRAHLGVFLVDLVAEITGEASAHDHVAHALEQYAQHQLLEMHVWQGSRLCGAVRLRDLDWVHRHGKIGYLLAADEQGRGVITRVLAVFLRWAFDELGLHRIELRCHPDNKASIAVARRLGFAFEGVARGVERHAGVFEDVMVHARLDND